jgi:hypothetical protein
VSDLILKFVDERPMDCFVMAAAIVILGEELCSGYGIMEATTPRIRDGSISTCVCLSVSNLSTSKFAWQ